MVVDLLFKFKANIQAIFNRSSEICKMIIFITKLITVKVKNIHIFVDHSVGCYYLSTKQSRYGNFKKILFTFSFFFIFQGGGGGSLVASLLGKF